MKKTAIILILLLILNCETMNNVGTFHIVTKNSPSIIETSHAQVIGGHCSNSNLYGIAEPKLDLAITDAIKSAPSGTKGLKNARVDYSKAEYYFVLITLVIPVFVFAYLFGLPNGKECYFVSGTPAKIDTKVSSTSTSNDSGFNEIVVLKNGEIIAEVRTFDVGTDSINVMTKDFKSTTYKRADILSIKKK